MKNNLLIALLLMCLFAALGMTKVYAYWGNLDSPITHTWAAELTIGDFCRTNLLKLTVTCCEIVFKFARALCEREFKTSQRHYFN